MDAYTHIHNTHNHGKETAARGSGEKLLVGAGIKNGYIHGCIHMHAYMTRKSL
jgi:hypothetical protein